MFDSSSIVVGLEIGTSKICAVVGEINASRSLNIIGVGQSRSRGVRKGEIAEPVLAEEDVRNAIVEAEQMANVEIRSVYLGVTGNHIRGFSNHGVHPVVSADREITEDDVQDAIKNAKAINLPEGNSIIHAIRQHFQVDAQMGMPIHPACLGQSRGGCSCRQPRQPPEEFHCGGQGPGGGGEVVFNGLASALALLSNEQKELGSLVIDIGGGTTDYAVYSDGIIKHTGVLAVGGDHVSNDLAYGLKVPLGRAEQLKLEHACAVLRQGQGRTIELPGQMGLPFKPSGTSPPHYFICAWRRFSGDRETFPPELAGTPARRGVSLRRRGAHPANPDPGGKHIPVACFSRQDQFHQRFEIRLGPAGVCHGHRFGAVWLAPAKAQKQ